MHKLIAGDCREILKKAPENSIDAVCTDPPYEINFMGRSWDNQGIAFNKATWAEVFRVMKPGAYLLSFGGARTFHRIAVAIEDAGFEIRDCIMWIFGSGMPKGMDIAKAIDKKDGNWRGRGGEIVNQSYALSGPQYARTDKGEPISALAQQWDGWNTALKPAFEPVIVARKPPIGTIVDNVRQFGVGGINVEGCRVGSDSVTINRFNDGAKPFGSAAGVDYHTTTSEGRWPANVIMDAEAAAILDAQVAPTKTTARVGKRSGHGNTYDQTGMGGFGVQDSVKMGYSDEGGPSRYFYQPKVSRKDRWVYIWCEHCEKGAQPTITLANDKGAPTLCGSCGESLTLYTHPTLKPVDLMRYLVRLITPKGGRLLDPFNGSGSTGVACLAEGFEYIGLDLDKKNIDISQARFDNWSNK